MNIKIVRDILKSLFEINRGILFECLSDIMQKSLYLTFLNINALCIRKTKVVDFFMGRWINYRIFLNNNITGKRCFKIKFLEINYFIIKTFVGNYT